MRAYVVIYNKTRNNLAIENNGWGDHAASFSSTAINNLTGEERRNKPVTTYLTENEFNNKDKRGMDGSRFDLSLFDKTTLGTDFDHLSIGSVTIGNHLWDQDSSTTYDGGDDTYGEAASNSWLYDVGGTVHPLPATTILNSLPSEKDGATMILCDGALSDTETSMMPFQLGSIAIGDIHDIQCWQPRNIPDTHREQVYSVSNQDLPTAASFTTRAQVVGFIADVDATLIMEPALTHTTIKDRIKNNKTGLRSDQYLYIKDCGDLLNKGIIGILYDKVIYPVSWANGSLGGIVKNVQSGTKTIYNNLEINIYKVNQNYHNSISSSQYGPITECSTSSYTGIISCYSFALQPEDHQPSGSCNFSRIDSSSLIFNSLETASTIDYIYATNYNVLRIMSGLGGLAYTS